MQCENEKRWNIFFFFLYIVFLAFFVYILHETRGAVPTSIPLFDLVLIALAIFRLIRLFVYDRITKFIREWFEEMSRGECCKSGFNAAVSHLLSCPWCMGIWIALPVVFFYFLTPIAWIHLLIIALAGIASLLQLFANMIGWMAETLKQKAQG